MTTMHIVFKKKQLRRALIQRRMMLPENVWARQAADCIDRLIRSVTWDQIHSLHCFVPMCERREIDTWPLFRYLWEQYPKIVTAVPGPLLGDQPTALVVDRQTIWRRTVIPLPETKIVTDGPFDLIVVPLLGFDARGYRLGYGQGYYDRLLKSQSHAMTIGVGFPGDFVAEGLPHESHDIPLRQVITAS